MKTIITSCAFGITAAVRDFRFFVLFAALAAPAVVFAAEQSQFDELLQAVTEELQPQTDADAPKQQAQPAQAMTHGNTMPAANTKPGDSGFIACPLAKVRTEVVTSLPDGWWQTPQVGKLRATRVQRIGGKPTLVCSYWAYGDSVSIMHLAPGGLSCQAREDGFACQ